jgi:hypothetical protein
MVSSSTDGVQQHAERYREAKFGEKGDGQGGERGEGARQHGAGRGDDPAGRRQPGECQEPRSGWRFLDSAYVPCTRHGVEGLKGNALSALDDRIAAEILLPFYEDLGCPRRSRATASKRLEASWADTRRGHVRSPPSSRERTATADPASIMGAASSRRTIQLILYSALAVSSRLWW